HDEFVTAGLRKLSICFIRPSRRIANVRGSKSAFRRSFKQPSRAKRELPTMSSGVSRSQIALAGAAALGAAALVTVSSAGSAGKKEGRYAAGDFHNHTTCSDGSISMQKLVKKATDKVDTPWGLDWFVQAGHGNSGGTRNCTLVEDDSLSTPAYPFIPRTHPQTAWTNRLR